MITLNSYEQAYEKASQQVTAQSLLNGRIYLKEIGWSDIGLTEEFRERVITDMVNLYGGHHKTRVAIRNTLTYSKPQHWGIDRTLLVKYGDSPARLSYCAGQDQVWECAAIRKFLK